MNFQMKVKRTKEQITAEKAAFAAEVEQQIDALLEEYHTILPQEKAEAIGAAYLRHSTRFQDSVLDQLRGILDCAVKKGIFIPRTKIYFDLGVSGKRVNRQGLNQLKVDVEKKEFDVLLAFTTSRLYRSNYKTMQFVEEELVERGIRAIFVKSHLDTTDDERWKIQLHMNSLLDEMYARVNVPHIHAAHETLFLNGMVCTSLSLGYTGEDVPGQFTRQHRPRQKIIIDPETSPWVQKIYDWYLAGKGQGEIARELNADPTAPPPQKSLTGAWTPVLVRSHLMNPAYRGFWAYGTKESNWSSKKDYNEQKLRDEPLQTSQFENLRLVSDETWYRTQELLAKEIKKAGRKSKDGDSSKRPLVLSQLFHCPEHHRKLVAGGAYGQYLMCPICRAIKPAERPIFTYLRRDLALEKTCRTVIGLIQSDPTLVDAIISACQAEIIAVQRPDPQQLDRLHKEAKTLMSKIDFNRSNPGESKEEQTQTLKLLKELQRKYAAVSTDLAALEAAQNSEIQVPSAEEVTSLLDEFAQTLTELALSENEEDMRTVRRIIDEVTGGQIDVDQKGENKPGRGWLQGRFSVDIIAVVTHQLSGIRLIEDPHRKVEITIDFRAESQLDREAEQVMELEQEGICYKEIGKTINRHRNYVKKLIKHWHESRGLTVPDGRARRKTLENKQTTTPQYQRLADEAVRLKEQNKSNLKIAEILNTSDTMIAEAIAWWYSSRGLPVPTARDWRHKVLEIANARIERGELLKDIAPDLDYTPRGLRLALDDYYAETGEVLPDGRSRRGNAKSGQLANGKSKA